MDGSQLIFATQRTFQHLHREQIHRWVLGATLGMICAGFSASACAEPGDKFIFPDELTTFEVDAAAKPLQAPGDPNPPPQLLRGRPRVLEATRSLAVAVLTNHSKNSARDNQSSRSHSVPPSIEEALATRGSVTFRKTPLSEVIFLLSDLWHINIVAGENVTGEVSGAFHDAPLGEVLTAVLSSSGYSYRKTGSSLIVLSADQVGADDANFVFKTLRIPSQLQSGDQAIEAARMMLSERGKINRLGTETILVIDTLQRAQRVEGLFRDLGGYSSADASATGHDEQTVSSHSGQGGRALTGSGIAYFTPQFTEAEQMAEPLQAALGDNVIVAVFPEENRIMIKGSPQDLEIASEAIEQLDRARPQVRITATIYDVSLKEVERLGINWNLSPHSAGTGLTDIADSESIRFRNLISASTQLVTDPSAAGAGNLAISTMNSAVNVDTLLQALHNNSEAKLLADPSVTVGDRRQASIRIVKKIPIIASDPVENSGVVFSQVQFEEAGVILNVLPRISRDGTIEMQVKPEYSVVADFIQNNPVIDSRTAETTVRVSDGQTFVIGGLRQKSVIESVRGVPFLKDIKFIGKWFRSHDTEIRESELIVFIKPELITVCYGGTAREIEAARLTHEELDAIPHAQSCPMTPCCKDPHCPNHHPKIRVNGGSEALRWNEFGEISAGHDTLQNTMIGPIEIIEPVDQAPPTRPLVPQTVELPQPNPQWIESSEAPSAQAVPTPQAVSSPPTVPLPRPEDGRFPPVHIDPRVF